MKIFKCVLCRCRVKGFAALTIAFLLSTSIGFAQQANTLDSLMLSYGQARQKIEADAVTAYSNALVTVGTQLKQKGDVDTYLILDTEKKRLALEGTIDAGTTNTTPAIADTAKSSVAGRNARMAVLLRQYVDGLDKLVKQLMVADKIDEAKAAKNMMDTAKSDLSVLESKIANTKPKTYISLADLTPLSHTVGYASLKIEPTNEMVFAHAPSKVLYDIPKGSIVFTAAGNIPSGNIPAGMGVFKYVVSIDGKEVFESRWVNTYKSKYVPIEARIPPNAKKIELIAKTQVAYNFCQSYWFFGRFHSAQPKDADWGWSVPASSDPDRKK